MLFGVGLLPLLRSAAKGPSDWYDDTLGLACLVDALGYEHVQISQRRLPSSLGCRIDWLTLGAVAALTVGVRVVTVAPERAFPDAIGLADKLAMLDQLAHGRLDLELREDLSSGAFSEVDSPVADTDDRHADLLSMCRQRWAMEDRVSGDMVGSFPRTSSMWPFQDPHPPVFVMPANRAASYAAVGHAGLHVQVAPSPVSREMQRDAIEAYREARAAAGWGPGQVRLLYACYLDHDRQAALAAARRWRDSCREDTVMAVLAGTPAQVEDQLATIADWLGDDVSVSLRIGPGGLPRSEVEHVLWLFAERIAPQFAKHSPGLLAP